jgi:hypothetical protein
VAGLGLAAIATAIGLAVVAGSSEPGPRPGPRSSSRPVAVASTAASGSSGPEPTPVTSARPSAARVERLLDVPDVALAGAPVVDLVVRVGQDLRVDRWTPGGGRVERTGIPGALRGWTAAATFPIFSPTDEHVLVLRLEDPTGESDQARLLRSDGTVAWETDDVRAISGAIWSPDGRTVVVAARSRAWHLVSLGTDGRATDRLVSLNLDQFIPSPPPIGSLSNPPREPRALPLGFSADGAWIYGGFVSPELGTLSETFRVGRDGSPIAWTSTLGLRHGDGLVPVPDSLGQRLVDPATGRLANWRVNSDTSGGPPTIEVRHPDKGLDFLVEDGTPIGSAWGRDGELFVLSADTLLFPNEGTLVRYGRDGTAGSPILEVGPVTGMGLFGYRDGFAGLGITVTRPTVAGQLVLVDVDAPERRTALELPVELSETLAAVRLRTPASP